MADEWSGSVVTLAGQGDWAEWTFTVPDSTAADHLNGDNAGVSGAIGIRGALPGPDTTALLVVIVNNAWIKNMEDPGPVASPGSSPDWVSADRFQLLTANTFQGFGTVNVNPFGILSGPLSDVYPFTLPLGDPFVVGTNTIRILNIGATAIEIDFLYLATAAVIGVPGFGDDDVAEPPPTGYAGHTDPTPSVQPTADLEWILEGGSAATGTADFAFLVPEKFCPRSIGTIVTTKIRLTDGGSPIVGETVWLLGATLVSATTDSDGIAELDLESGNNGEFFYLGSQDWMPCATTVPGDARIGCNGWHVGRIGVG